jgi:deoxyribodipyrimidine photo-lyase
LNAWKEGKTGYPIVDAGMRELNETGHMHNRVRMICASFLVKDLHINWKEGEKYFAQKLVDYDPSVNNGNWQWSASTGCDAQPYFRIFNPKLQQERFDPHCKYVKMWVLEIRDCPVKKIMEIYEGEEVENYPKRIVDHKKEVEITKEMYKRAENSHL